MIRSNGPLVEIQGDNEGEAISSQGGFASSYKSGSMRSLLDTEVNRERGREGREGGRGGRGDHQNLKLAPWDKSSKLAQISVGGRDQKSGGKLRSHRRPFHPDYCFLYHRLQKFQP